MDGGTTDDDHARAQAVEPDAHGHAALLLVESLIHLLIDREVISLAEAIDAVGIASDVGAEIADDRVVASAALQRALSLLAAISVSLRIDDRERSI